ncbi:transglutaminase family protein [Xanthobacter autotrophicus]|uniref:Transglutaminase family protein n=1 Tax=Xanthobacter autotrophicus TaxID=280 RepID=A0A6C1KX38_XANAU|nr:transglutaminase family protein [Xanthobacter autotrophicus]TLX44193.1 transglutaminase family protein [Xanthobacter autotrophicus]
MSILASLHHVTSYKYERPVTMGPQTIRLRPAPHSRTEIPAYSLKISPAEHFINWQQDPFGNWLARIVFPEKVEEFKVEVDLLAKLDVLNPFDFFVEEYAENFPFTYTPELKAELAPYLELEKEGAPFDAFVAGVSLEPRRIVDFLVEINQLLQKEIGYVIRMEPGVQTPDETLTKKLGSCRDTGWLLVQVLRHLGLAARFVSGYLIQLKPDVAALDGPSGTDVDFTDLHAWCEVYVPGAGWIGLDPTSGLLCGEGHIPLAATPHYRSAAPITGYLMEKTETEFGFDMSVARVAEAPRVTLPFSDETWAALDELGQKVDVDLKAGDVRLTMGGEPTFVSIDDYESPEWNTEALGPQKRVRADDLIRRLRKRFSTEGVLHYGQGKWYPGETLPRWSFDLFWRKDGQPMWRREDLIADEKTNYAPTPADAERFCRAVAEKLAVGSQFVLPAYEDNIYYMWKEQCLPENIAPGDERMADEVQRRMLARTFNQGLANATGSVLPLRRVWTPEGFAWRSELWTFRREFLFLIPGESPMGYRLPLESLQFLAPTRYPYVVPTDPFEPRGPLPDADELAARYRAGGEGTAGTDGATPVDARERYSVAPRREAYGTGERAQELVRQYLAQNDTQVFTADTRTALCVEPRNGRLCVFLPPVETLEDYVDLIAAVEQVAIELNTPLHLEGYPPPFDYRLNLIRLAPDPGVLEVNVHPSDTWSGCVEITRILYEEARLARLGTEKFMVDGRHTGTGGGNHVVVGGSTPADSPFLRRPDLLKSLLLFWQRHPSLSYMFSGLFIGPTSQHPRVDEARHDSLYELEIALSKIGLPGAAEGPTPPWLVDRLLRNLLVDVTGNTHRTEISIDKLYSPDGPTGRLGLVEFRCFEMPPDWRMSLAQQLLLRALIARLWHKPVTGKCARWGTILNDRFMLPHYVWADFVDVLEDLSDAGYSFDPEWFRAQFEFRFPHYGKVQRGGVDVEIRQALECWHVLGEEGVVGGTARYVDSSVERLQVKVEGFNPARHIVTCNGRRLPLAPTGRNGTFVAGVRYKAWQPWSGLHPTIPVQAPLTFDVVDTWSERSRGGCRYYVSHPGGRSYETFPVNSYEAEARRLARFQDYGHTPGTTPVPEENAPDEFPTTLDLRRPIGA